MSENKNIEMARRIVAKLRKAGHEAYFAGGAVRDIIMGHPPQDIDVTTSARPEEVMDLFYRTVPVGASFGVVVVMVGDASFEVATFRSEGKYLDGRRPAEVSYSTAREDVKRRDFTINGLLYDPEEDEVIDFVEGRRDIELGIVRSIGDPERRFSEDHLRLLRAVRFAARFDFDVEERTWEAICHHSGDIVTVSGERIRDELLKMLTGGRPRRAVEMMSRSGLLGHILPEVAGLRGINQPMEHHPEGDAFDHLLACLQAMEDLYRDDPSVPSETLALAVLLHDVGKKETTESEPGGRPRSIGHARAGAKSAKRICKRLKLSNKHIATVVSLVADHMKPMVAKKMGRAKLKKLMRQPHFEELLELHRIDRMGGSGDLGDYAWLRARYEEMGPEDLRPVPLLDGRNLMEMGYAPGPGFGKALSVLEDAQLEGRVKTREGARKLVREVLGAPPGDQH